MVGVPATRHRDVEQLACLVAGDHGVGGVGGHPLGGVDGGRVAELDVVADVVGGQRHGLAAVEVVGGEAAVGMDGADGPAVPVPDPVVRGGDQSAFVAAGEDGVAGTCVGAVGQPYVPGPRIGGCVGEAVGLGPCVEAGDEVAGGCEQNGVDPGPAVGGPGVVGLLGDGGDVPDVDAALVGVEAEGAGVALAQREGGGRLGAVVEAAHLRQGGRADGLCDVAQHAAGADCTELLVVADQAHAAAAADDVVDGGGELGGGRSSGLVDEDQGAGADASDPVGSLIVGGVGEAPGELGQGVGVARADVAEFLGRLRGGGETEDLAAGVGPGASQHPHGGGLAGAGGCEGQLESSPGGGEVVDQAGLGVVEHGAPGGVVGDRKADPDVADPAPPGRRRGREQSLLGLQDAGGRVPGRPVDLVDAVPVRAAQRRRFAHRVWRPEPGRVLQRLGDEAADDMIEVTETDGGGSRLPFGFRAQMPDLPGGAGLLQDSDHVPTGRGEPRVGGTTCPRR